MVVCRELLEEPLAVSVAAIVEAEHPVARGTQGTSPLDVGALGEAPFLPERSAQEPPPADDVLAVGGWRVAKR